MPMDPDAPGRAGNVGCEIGVLGLEKQRRGVRRLVVREERVLTTLIGVDIAEPLADDERASVQHAQGALRQARASS